MWRATSATKVSAAGWVEHTLEHLGRLDILVNNAAEQHPQDTLEDISADQLERTFRTNVFAMFFLAKAALPHLPAGATIVNTTSVGLAVRRE